MAVTYDTIYFKRGLDANLPATANNGEPLWTTDTHRMFVGYGNGIKEIAGAEDLGYVTPEMFGTDNTIAWTDALATGLSIKAAPNATYIVTSGLVAQSNTVIDLNGSELQFEVNGESNCLQVLGENIIVCNGTITNNGTGVPINDGLQAPVTVGSFLTPSKSAKNILLHNLVINQNSVPDADYTGANGINVVGNVDNVLMQNITFPGSATLGCPILVHWGFDSEAVTTTTYHPNNVVARNITIGSMTNAVYAGLGCIALQSSGATNVVFENATIEYTSGYGCYASIGDRGYSFAETPLTETPAVTFRNINILSSKKRGFYAFGLTNYQTLDEDEVVEPLKVIIETCCATGTGTSALTSLQDGITFDYISNAQVNNTDISKFRKGSYLSRQCENITFNNCNLHDNEYNGSDLSTSSSNTHPAKNIVYNQCVLTGNGTVTTNAGASSGIKATYVYGLKVRDCIFGGDLAEASQQHGVFIDTISRGIVLDGNLFRNTAESNTGIGGTFTDNAHLLSLASVVNNISENGVLVYGTEKIIPVQTLNAGARLFSGPYGKPIAGDFVRGDTIVASDPSVGLSTGFVCTSSGSPGIWRMLSQMAAKGATSVRDSYESTLTAVDYGFIFMDTTIDADGFPVLWNGTKWIKFDGTDA